MTDERSNTSKNQILPLLFLTTIFLIGFTSRLLLAPLMPAIEKDLMIGHDEAGSFFFFVSAGLFISLLFSGIIVSKITHRTAIVLSSTILGIALMATALTRDIWQIYLCLFFWGISGGLYLPSGIATLTTLIKPAHWGKALAVHELAPNLGFVAVPLLVEILFNWFSWRGIPAFFGSFAILMGILFARYSKGGRFHGETPKLSTYTSLLGNASFWIMILLFTLGVTGTLGIFTMLPLYLISERGMERELANNLIGLSRISCIFVPFVAGWITDRLGAKRTLAGIFTLAGLITILLGLAPDSWIVVVLFMQPVFAVCFFPAGFAAISSIGSPSQRNYAVSLTSAFALLLGGGFVPVCLGILGEKASFSLGISLAGGMMVTGAFMALGLKLTEDA
jgi:NNP family nitrate/nitrite transporter-like MFS transporter